jgi:predicted PurR-regulated permease PerM
VTEPSEPTPPPAPPTRGIGIAEGLPPWSRPLFSLGTAAVLGLALWAVYTGLGDFLTVLLLAFVIGYVLDPLIDRFEAAGWDRTLGIGITLGIAVSGIVVGVLLIVPYIAGEIADLSDRIDEYTADVVTRAKQVEEWVATKTGQEVGIAALTERLPDLLREMDLGSLDPMKTVASTLAGGTFGLLGAVFRYSLLPIFVFFFLRDFDVMKRAVFEMVPFRSRATVLDHYIRIDEKIAKFLRGQAMVCVWLAVLYSAGLLIFTDIHLALFIGVMSGVLFIVPYLGTVLGVGLGCLMALLQFGLSFEILKVIAVFGAVQGIEGALLTPKVVGDSVGLHPVVVMLALLVGGNLFGLLGVLLAVPVAASIQVILATGLEDLRRTPWFQRGKDEAPSPDQLP